MSENKNHSITPSKGAGFFQDLVMRAKLILRLMGDKRVSPLLKLLPIGVVAYVVWPLDLLPGPIDDAAVLSLGLYFFVEMCPPDVVEEHMRALRPNLPGGWDDLTAHPEQSAPPPAKSDGEVIDGEFREVK